MTLNATNYSISKSLFEKIANAFKSAVKFIHRRGGYKAEYLKEEEVKPLIEHTYEAFSEAVDFGVKDNVIPEAMKMYLKNNTFVFSGFKTHQQLDRVSRLLHDDDGHVKPFNRFLQDVKSIDKKYNRTYLQAEYNFAVASAQSAGKWHEFAEYADRYYLQYRTAKDERVREEHAILDGITLPMDDPFWDEYYVPLGWNCRCQVVQVSKKRYEPSNPSEALARGRAATYKPNADGVNKAAIFRFNPGKEQRIFPKKHPYFPKGCGDCGLKQYAVGKGKPMCTACALLQKGKQDHINDINKIVKQQLIPNLNYSHPDLPEIAKANKKTAGELTWHKSTSLNLIKTYDILEHIDKYLTSDADIFEEKVVYQHNTKTKVINMYVLQSKYKGDLSIRKNEIIQLLFRRELAKNGNPYIRLYYIRDWKSEKDYLDWKKKTGR